MTTTAPVPQIADTPELVVARNEIWAQHLDENKLKAKGRMRFVDHRCCLAVAEDAARLMGWIGKEERGSNLVPSASLGEFYGWYTPGSGCIVPMLQRPSPDPMCKNPDDSGTTSAAKLNDARNMDTLSKRSKWINEGLTHPQIAECVRHTFCGLDSPWSFSFTKDPDADAA